MCTRGSRRQRQAMRAHALCDATLSGRLLQAPLHMRWQIIGNMSPSCTAEFGGRGFHGITCSLGCWKAQ
jgi:hypothetical protein